MSDIYNPLSFVFSDDPKTGALTYEQLVARRKIAAAIATRNRQFPKTIGEGLTYLGESLGDAYADRRMEASEKRYREETDEKLRGVLAPTAPAVAAPAAPAAPPAGPGPMSPNIDPFGGGFSENAPAPDEEMNALALASPADTQPVQTKPQQKFPELPPGVRPKMPIPEFKQRIARTEPIDQSNPYKTVGEQNRRGDFPYGKYAIMGENIPKWSKEYLGKEMTPQQFLDDDKAQEEIASARSAYYLNKYGENGAAAAWFAGEHGMNDEKRMHTLGRHVDEYVKRFNIPLASRDDVTASAVGGAAPQQFAALGGAPVSDAAPETVAQGPQSPMQPTPVPQQRIAQAPPIGTPVPSYVSPAPGPPQEPRPTPMTEQEARMRALMAANPNDPRIQGLRLHVEQMEAKRKFDDARNVEQWKDDLQTYRTRTDPAYQQKLQDDQQKAAAAARERQRELNRGGVPQSAFDKKLEASEKAVAPLREASTAINQVEELLDRGMFTGLTGKLELAIAKAKQAASGAVDPRVAATEQFTSSIKPITAAARAALVGGANISDKDLAAAEAAAGGDITLTEEGIRSIMKSLRTIQLQTAMHHQKVLSTTAGGDTAAEATLNGLYGLPMENIISKNHPAVQRLMQNPDNEHERGLFDAAFHTPGLATKIIVRARPRQ